MKKVIIAIILVASLMPLVQSSDSASATGKTIAQKIDCAKATTTPELKYCSQQSYQAADKKLNQVYKQVISRINAQQKRLLITGQQAWIKFRDNNCDFETYGSRGGTGYEIFRNGCLERLTEQRTKDLQAYLSR
jgi:uncharacterized protein YecT (DUF1311 family)